MRRFLCGAGEPVREILCIGAHCDDIEIGCGGALLELANRFRGVKVRWVVFAGESEREKETRSAAQRILGQHADGVEVHRFRASYFPTCIGEIKDVFEQLKSRVNPDLIFTHCLHDRHQDHRVLAELTWNTFRNHTLLEYEILKYEGDLGQPNVYLPLSTSAVDHKVKALMDCFPSQRSRTWFDEGVFRALMRIRGVECNSESGFAEAFHCRKLTL
jgi:LmbE family N-acetylglucosaminyl deacetylase